jgi:hypothetical protein
MTALAQPKAPGAGPTGRFAVLLDAIREQRGRWNAVRDLRLYRQLDVNVPPAQLRAIARGDLRDLAAWGWLQLHDQPSNRFYTLNSRKDVRP